MKIQFTKKCGIEGITYEAGDVVDLASISPGSLHSMKLLGLYEELPEDPVAEDEGEAGTDGSENEPSGIDSLVESNQPKTKGRK